MNASRRSCLPLTSSYLLSYCTSYFLPLTPYFLIPSYHLILTPYFSLCVSDPTLYVLLLPSSPPHLFFPYLFHSSFFISSLPSLLLHSLSSLTHILPFSLFLFLLHLHILLYLLLLLLLLLGLLLFHLYHLLLLLLHLLLLFFFLLLLLLLLLFQLLLSISSSHHLSIFSPHDSFLPPSSILHQENWKYMPAFAPLANKRGYAHRQAKQILVVL